MATVTSRVRDSGVVVRDRSMNILDSYVPPSQRQEYSDAVRQWSEVNPKLAAFVAAQLLLSGPPILLFLAFSFTVLTSTLLVCLITALTVTFAFTALCTGLAVLVLIPTLLVSSLAATFLFVTGVIGTAAVSKFNNDPRTEGIRSRTRAKAAAVGDRVKDVSNGSIDLNAAAQHFANKASETIPYTANESTSDERAREYLTKQALGIPDRYEGANGAGRPTQQSGNDFDAISDRYVQAAANPSTGNHSSYSTPEDYREITSRLQPVS